MFVKLIVPTALMILQTSVAYADECKNSNFSPSLAQIPQHEKIADYAIDTKGAVPGMTPDEMRDSIKKEMPEISISEYKTCIVVHSKGANIVTKPFFSTFSAVQSGEKTRNSYFVEFGGPATGNQVITINRESRFNKNDDFPLTIDTQESMRNKYGQESFLDDSPFALTMYWFYKAGHLVKVSRMSKEIDTGYSPQNIQRFASSSPIWDYQIIANIWYSGDRERSNGITIELFDGSKRKSAAELDVKMINEELSRQSSSPSFHKSTPEL